MAAAGPSPPLCKRGLKSCIFDSCSAFRARAGMGPRIERRGAGMGGKQRRRQQQSKAAPRAELPTSLCPWIPHSEPDSNGWAVWGQGSPTLRFLRCPFGLLPAHNLGHCCRFTRAIDGAGHGRAHSHAAAADGGGRDSGGSAQPRPSSAAACRQSQPTACSERLPRPASRCNTAVLDARPARCRHSWATAAGLPLHRHASSWGQLHAAA